MARSQLLKDVVSGKGSLENILLRLKVILSDLDNEPIINWVNGELQGYKEEKDVPIYRLLRGMPVGTYIVNYTAKYTNAPVPLEILLSPDEIDALVNVPITDGIASLQNILNSENSNNYAYTVPTAYCHGISKDQLQIATMQVNFPSNRLDGIVSNVKTKLLEIIMELEEQFKNLDELDIRPQIEEDSNRKEEATYNIHKIIYENSINLGDKNKISSSRLGNIFGGKKG